MHEGHVHFKGQEESVHQLQLMLNEKGRFEGAAALFQVLADPNRLRLFWILCHREECVVNLGQIMNMSSPAVSHHLKIMKDGGLIESRRVGKEVHYRVADVPACRLLHPMAEGVLEISCPQEQDMSDSRIIQRVHDHLVENLHQRLTIETLSRQFLLNPTTLKTKFQQMYGMSIAAHVKQHRMEKAAQLILSTDETMESIAKKVGFTSQSRFADAFRDHYGVLPSEYRKNNPADA